LNDLFPRRSIARPTPANQLGSFAHRQSFHSPHRIFSRYLCFGIRQSARLWQEPLRQAPN